MAAIKGDFIGFTFGGKHSSELGIVRVSNGSRYTETLLPEFSNKTVVIPGADRTNYLGMEYTQKTFPLEIAFDSVTETQLRDMKRLFSSKKPLSLIFDESPYKTYYAKAASPPSLSYICFDEDGNRVYKGEGKIDLVSFYPYAFCDLDEMFVEITPNNYTEIIVPNLSLDNIKYGFMHSLPENKLETTTTNVLRVSNQNPRWDGSNIYIPMTVDDGFYYNTTNGEFFLNNTNKNEPYIMHHRFYFFLPFYNNIPEWFDTAKITAKSKYTKIINISDDSAKMGLALYNPGDFDSNFMIIGKINAETGGIRIQSNTYENFSLSWSGIPIDTKIRINTYNQLIEGLDENDKPNGIIYNQYIISGSWFTIPCGFGDNEDPEGSWWRATDRLVCEGIKEGHIDYKILYI